MTTDNRPSGIAYRQIALERLSSPEQLDQLMEVTRLRSWLALAGLGMLLVVALVWSIFGSIPTKISADGMLIRPGGLFDIYAPDQGNVKEVRVAEGQVVQKGQPVATIDVPELTAQIEELKTRLTERRQHLQQLKQPAGVFQGLTRQALALESANEQVAIQNGERTLEGLTDRLKSSSIVESPYSGRILEIKVRPGDIISRGAKLLSLQLSEQDTKGLQAVIYVPSANGKTVIAGMAAQISPSTAAREEYGFLFGKVVYVSDFPATREGMMRVLANENLVAALSMQGPPFAVYADLIPDPASASGYKWSSGKGSEVKVNSGTPCEVFITVREQHPIELVLPLIRQFSGL